MIRLFLISLGLLWATMLCSQNYIRNGSLEGNVPQFDNVPQFWNKCRTQNSPDIQPISTKQVAFEGTAFLGLAVYGSSPSNPDLILAKETFGQGMDTLTPGFEYLISIALSYDPDHLSSQGETEAPARLRVYMGDGCVDSNYIWQTPLIDHEDWKIYEHNYIAECNNSYITFQATHGDLLRLDAGYILIDLISVIPVNNESALDTVNCGPREEPLDTIQDMTPSPGPCLFYIPTAFTPNHDGVNDEFNIQPACHFTEFQVEVFNRWGNRVFHSTDPAFSWTGASQDTGAYIYHITTSYLDENGGVGSYHYANTIYLLR